MNLFRRCTLALACLASLAQPVAAATLSATPATADVTIAAATGGDTILFAKGEYPTLTVRKFFNPPVTLQLGKQDDAKLSLVVTNGGGGLVVIGGTIRSTGGGLVSSQAGYGAWLDGRAGRITNVSFINNKWTYARKALVSDLVTGLLVTGGNFDGVAEDGSIVSRTENVTITHNTYANFTPLPTKCTLPAEVRNGVAQRDCIALGGKWQDGQHGDAIQIRNLVLNAIFGWNKIAGTAQGIGEFGTTGDLPSDYINVIFNDVGVVGNHSITFYNCKHCVVTDNNVYSLNPSLKTVLRVDPVAKFCNNKSVTKSEGTKACL